MKGRKVLIYKHHVERTRQYIKDITDGLMTMFHAEKRSENQGIFRIGSIFL
jgi:hypothetical protein